MVSYNQTIDIVKEDVTDEPVTLAEAKAFCKVDVSDDDDLIAELITAAREYCESYTGIAFVKREFITTFNNCNGGYYLPYGPIEELTKLEDEDGTEIEAADYKVAGTNWMKIKEPKALQLTATYTGGYETLPNILKTALLNAIFYLYDNRSVATDSIGPIAESKLKMYRRV